jgi:hypothetical protein
MAIWKGLWMMDMALNQIVKDGSEDFWAEIERIPPLPLYFAVKI